MKKFKRFLIALTFAASLLCLAMGLAACDSDPKLLELRVENARVSFMRGDEFETGDDFTVIAVFKDGTEKDVTAEAAIRQEKGMDMNVPGDYQITVSYSNKRTIYTVYVNDSEDILRKIELDSSAVKKNYELGDSVSLDGLSLTLTYENSQGATFSVKAASLKDFNVEIKSAGGDVIGSVFTSLGDFTVTVSKGSVKASFDVSVEGINISTVQGAIAVGGFYKNRVVSGEAVVKENSGGNGLVESSRYEYEYGDNYTRFSDMDSNPVNTYHCSEDNEGLFVVQLQGGKIVTSNMSHPDMMNGSPYLLWYLRQTVYGIEDTLSELYERAKKCSNDDLKETADETKREYSFSFSGLEFFGNNNDYYETTVSFKLGADYTIVSAEYRQDYYEDNSAWEEGERTFSTDPATGKTEPKSAYPSHYTVVTVSQTAGTRTAQNAYSRNMFKIASFDLKYDGKTLEDGDVLKCDVATKTYAISVENVLPVTANFELDALRLDYEGNRTGADATLLYSEHFTVYRQGLGIRLTVNHGGKWKLIFKTESVTKTLTIDVTGEAPTSIASQVYNAASGSFYAGDTKTLSLNGETYFYGAVNAYANGAQEAELLSGNGEAAAITKTQIGGVDCFKFSASEEGEYKVRVTSTANPAKTCDFTFKVNSGADFSELLSGSYTAEDAVGVIYRLTFRRDDEGDLIKGAVTVTQTPTKEDGTPITEKEVTETLLFYVEDLEIVVEHSNNDKIWISLTVNEEGDLVLIDFRVTQYPLERITP